MKVAIVVPGYYSGGAERVIDALLEIYPEADIFALTIDRRYIPDAWKTKKIVVSNLDKYFGRLFRWKLKAFMFLLPWAVESMDVSSYDLVISSYGLSVAGINQSQNSTHVCYCHSPERLWWHQYAKQQNELGWITRQIYVLCASIIRTWEYCAMQRVDVVVSNSRYIAHRIYKYFRRSSIVVYPPVNTSIGYISNGPKNYYLTVSRLDANKRIDICISACNTLKRKLIIVGCGPDKKRLKALAGPNIEFLGHIPDENIASLYANCRAFLFAADEDFGIAPVEAQSFGRPVIAYGHGGVLETVRASNPIKIEDTGVLFLEQSSQAMANAITDFEKHEHMFIPATIRKHALQFDSSVFKQRIQNVIQNALREAVER